MAGRKMKDLEKTSQENGSLKRPFLIGVAGGTASGKSSVCEKIVEELGQHNVDCRRKKIAILTLDDFYKVLDRKDQAKSCKGTYNFDHPGALDTDLIRKTLKDIHSGQTVKIPKYDKQTNSRKEDEFTTIYPADVVLCEGILTFYWKDIRDMFDMKLFVDTDADTRLSRRVLCDIKERGRDLDTILVQYVTYVKPAFEEFCLPTKKYADVIIPRGVENTVAIGLITQHIKDILNGGLKYKNGHGNSNGGSGTNGYSSNGFTGGLSERISVSASGDVAPPRKRNPSESGSRPH
ncbi:uridine-cytidine kinase 2-like [Amphiura filiformis]|uniref:uridine-cytidine kinase 2-like n=1 Tax=Amphiura filiformis TaxID=82378 RepID=UPI003B21DEA8